MNVNEKGVKGLIKVIDDLQERGYYTFPAFDDHSPIDLIACDKNGRAIRLQVKYRTKMPNRKTERYELPSRSSVNGKAVYIDRNLIDGWAVYLLEANKIVYIPKDIVPKSGLVIDPEKYYGELDEWFKSAPC